MSWIARLFGRAAVVAAEPPKPLAIPVLTIGADPRPWDASADARFMECLQVVLRHEGGFVDHPADPGGATNHGISLRYARTRGSLFDLDGDGDVDRDDILLVTPAKAGMVYREWFWRDVRGDDLPAGMDLAAFDFAVNSGAGRAVKALQRAVGAVPDGFFGPATMESVRLAAPRAAAVVEAICNERIAFLRSLATWPTFGRGWAARVEDVRARARVMAG